MKLFQMYTMLVAQFYAQQFLTVWYQKSQLNNGSLFWVTLIEIDNEEVPLMVRKIFVEKINDVGFKISNQAIKVIKINNKIDYKDGKRNFN